MADLIDFFYWICQFLCIGDIFIFLIALSHAKEETKMSSEKIRNRCCKDMCWRMWTLI